jgi:hypothetical protein
MVSHKTAHVTDRRRCKKYMVQAFKYLYSIDRVDRRRMM